MDVTEQELQELYTWVDDIPLSRPKRNIARDFSDGVLMAEIVHHYYPKLVELHNYSSANATTQKMYNWNTLNGKVFRRMGFVLAKPEFEAVANCQPGAIERVLKLLKVQLARCKEEGFSGLPTAPSLVSKASTGPAGGPVRSAGPASPIAAHRLQPRELPQALSYTAAAAAAAAQPPAPQPAPPAAHTAARAVPGNAASRAADRAAGELLAEQEQTIHELKETNEILETKVRKLEQLVRLKDAKISTLVAKLQSAGVA